MNKEELRTPERGQLVPESAASSVAPPAPRTRSQAFVRSLYFRVLVGILGGILVGIFFPHFGEALKPIADGFIKLIRMLIAPVIFFTVLLGVASAGDLRKLGRIGLKAIVYFEAVTTLALLIGVVVATLVQPGRGLKIDPRTLDPRTLASSPVAQYTAASSQLSVSDFLLNLIPESFAGAFTHGEILQVLLLAILCGVAMTMLDRKEYLSSLVESLSRLFFKIVSIVMQAAPLGAFGAMAFTIGRYGLATLFSLAKLLGCVYLTSIAFVAIVLGLICLSNGINLWRLLVYLREELLIVLGTSSSEAALPRLMLKMENLGCSKTITGLVIPAGYSFNLDGTSIYLTIAALFIAQATQVHLTLRQQAFMLALLMLNSKGAAAVTGGGFITLAATLAALGTIPVAGIMLIVGVDRFMSEMRSLTNLIGNGVATIVVARWEGQFDDARARSILHPLATHPSTAHPLVTADIGTTTHSQATTSE